jgi:hypothetical protein
MQQQNGTSREFLHQTNVVVTGNNKGLTELTKHPFGFDNEIILPRTNMRVLKVGSCSKANRVTG